jgi:predicted ABC-type transport system involved in lysophospholipase L1 biosynthesis ATPase subunit
VLLQLEGVVKRYRRGTEEVVALDGVDLTVGPGESVAVVGPSGSGKSTLLHLAGGLDLPDAGTVRLDGRDLAALSLRDRARVRRRDIGFVFQFFHLVPSLTVAENVELPLLLEREGGNGSPGLGGRRGRRRRVAELLDRVGVGERSGHLPGELSGGELQRAAIARALAAGPRLVLADEPTGNLDSATGRSVLDLLFGLVGDGNATGGDPPKGEAAGGTALVMVTHDEGAASRAGRIVRVRDGRLAAPA